MYVKNLRRNFITKQFSLMYKCFFFVYSSGHEAKAKAVFGHAKPSCTNKRCYRLTLFLLEIIHVFLLNYGINK